MLESQTHVLDSATDRAYRAFRYHCIVTAGQEEFEISALLSSIHVRSRTGDMTERDGLQRIETASDSVPLRFGRHRCVPIIRSPKVYHAERSGSS